MLMVGALLCAGNASAQEEKPAAKPETKPAPKAGTKTKSKIPAPENVELLTKDNVRLKATYYAGMNGKETVPIIIVHDSESDRNAFHDLAKSLQAKGHAVIVPDLRGYGGSTLVEVGGGKPDIEIDKKKMQMDAYPNMVGIDMDKVKSFLREKNDQGQLNLNQLVVIGVGDLGSAIAANWTVRDWAFPDLVNQKQGKDVHALILVSPGLVFKNLKVTQLLQALAKIEGPAKQSWERISFMYVVGAGKPGTSSKPTEWRNAKKHYDSAFQFHSEPARDDIAADQTLFFAEMPTDLQGAKLLDKNVLRMNAEVERLKPVPLETLIHTFIDWRVSAKAQHYEWSKRR
jgi:pimeloyl-ACP methyl ester carboxylesterase